MELSGDIRLPLTGKASERMLAHWGIIDCYQLGMACVSQYLGIGGPRCRRWRLPTVIRMRPAGRRPIWRLGDGGFATAADPAIRRIGYPGDLSSLPVVPTEFTVGASVPAGRDADQ